MQKSLNRVTLIGNLGKDPQTRFTNSGTSVTELSVATNYSYKDKSGEWKKETEWHNVVGFSLSDEIRSLRQGNKLYVEGRIKSQSYNDREGNPRKNFSIVADMIVPLSDLSVDKEIKEESLLLSDNDDLPF